MIDVIKYNLIAKTNVTSNVTTGDTVVFVENSFHFKKDEEVVLIDWNYNNPDHSHYNVFEYAKIKEVNNTKAITLTSEAIDNWLVSDNTTIQKTIGHSPLYDDNVYYGDREVIPTNDMAIVVEPTGLTNEWIYIQGGLSEEYSLKIIIYGKDATTDEGRRILDKYADVLYHYLNEHLHFPVKTFSALLTRDVTAGDTVIYIQDTAENRENVTISTNSEIVNPYFLQDNLKAECQSLDVIGVNYIGGEIEVTLDRPVAKSYSVDEFGYLFRAWRHFYDSRVTNISYGYVSKGSALLRAAELTWFGKEVEEYKFPQVNKNV
jgi:hypothetical protein